MADIILLNDAVSTIPIVYKDAGGVVVPKPATDVASAVTTGPHAASLGVVMVALPSGQAAATLTPMVAESDAANGGGAIGLTITDTANLPMEQSYTFSISPDLSPAAIDLDTAAMTTVPQAVPTAPGP
jgi:hypothetical protein